ncbi:MAG: hypothetical protein HY216_15720 [Candidatus Rokubacteria bacterium]|nr:hypothetical protein [Candidatus Rokubacteria bacterium]
MSRYERFAVVAVGVPLLAVFLGVAVESEAWMMRQTKRGNLVECVPGTEKLTPDGLVTACRQDVTKPFSPTNVAGNMVKE